MRESQFQAELKESFHHYCPNGIYVKIPDMPRSRTSRFIPQKPYDIILILPGRMIAMETKLLKKGKTSISKSSETGKNMLRQVMVLHHTESLGFGSYLAVEIVGKFRGMEKKIKKAFFFTPVEIAQLIYRGEFSVAGIIKFTNEGHGITCERKDGLWDLKELTDPIDS
jgi:hypothetical protein